MIKQSIRLALAQINTVVGDLAGNADKIISYMETARKQGVDIVSFPELAITGYPPEDLLFKAGFVENNLSCLKKIAIASKDIVGVIGFADKVKNDLYNSAAIVCNSKIKNIYHKVLLPNYGVFDEKRYFKSGEKFPVFSAGKIIFGVNICEDIWDLKGPAAEQIRRGAKLIVNINASPYHIGKSSMRQDILQAQAKKHKVFISYTNLVGAQDELVFDGRSMVVDDKGKIIAKAKAFEEQLLVVDLDIGVSAKKKAIFLKDTSAEKPVLEKTVLPEGKDEAREVYEALVLGLRDYVLKNGFKKVVLGLSGGIDSSLVASLACDAIGKENVTGVSMPSDYTSFESKEDAEILSRNLGIEFLTIPISSIFKNYLEVFKEVFATVKPDVTEENLQARIRGNIIMALSNKFGYLALNTGNKSEVSCGYCTLYGDMAGGFGAIKDVPKTLVYKLCEYKNKKEQKEVIPLRVLQKAPTAELRPNQKDSDTLPEYDLLDRILKLYVEEDKAVDEIVRSGIKKDVVLRVIKMVDTNEYKRRQAPPGIKITPKAFGRDRRMPITNKYR